MRTINKLNFNSDRIIKTVELTTIRGGDNPSANCCVCHILMGGTQYATNSSPSTCNSDCYTQFGGWGSWACIV